MEKSDRIRKSKWVEPLARSSAGELLEAVAQISRVWAPNAAKVNYFRLQALPAITIATPLGTKHCRLRLQCMLVMLQVALTGVVMFFDGRSRILSFFFLVH